MTEIIRLGKKIKEQIEDTKKDITREENEIDSYGFKQEILGKLRVKLDTLRNVEIEINRISRW